MKQTSRIRPTPSCVSKHKFPIEAPFHIYPIKAQQVCSPAKRRFPIPCSKQGRKGKFHWARKRHRTRTKGSSGQFPEIVSTNAVSGPGNTRASSFTCLPVRATGSIQYIFRPGKAPEKTLFCEYVVGLHFSTDHGVSTNRQSFRKIFCATSSLTTLMILGRRNRCRYLGYISRIICLSKSESCSLRAVPL
jgi:hypothetical protein